ncbi:hypothetical protein [Streptomyces cacaoi]|uniref:hypothetical protein n=1 Tax=Streptomyces cacaoi TaxID=1898 RepID=UPI00374A74E3
MRLDTNMANMRKTAIYMSEGGEGQRPHSEEVESKQVERLPVESVLSSEGAKNLLPYVAGELQHITEEKGSLDERAASSANQTPEGILLEDMHDLGVGTYNSWMKQRKAGVAEPPSSHPDAYPEGYADMSAATAAYTLLAYPRLSAMEQGRTIDWALQEVKTWGTHSAECGGNGIWLGYKGAELVQSLTERTGLAYDKSQQWIPLQPALDALERNFPESKAQNAERDTDVTRSIERSKAAAR